MEGCKINNLLSLDETIAKELFLDVTYPWEVLPRISDYIIKLGESLPEDKYNRIAKHIWIAKSAYVDPSVHWSGPLIIDEEAEIRHCAFIRGSAIIGKKCVVGNSCEIKNSILFNNCEVPHYNYVGDSILGFHAHMGAGSITSNIKSDRKNIVIKAESDSIESGMRKIGAILGDWTEIGCNTVLNPGTVVGKNTTVYPLSIVRGVIPNDSIVKNQGNISIVPKKEM